MVGCSEEKVHLTMCLERLRLLRKYCLLVPVVGVGFVVCVDSLGVWGCFYSSTEEYGGGSCVLCGIESVVLMNEEMQEEKVL